MKFYKDKKIDEVHWNVMDNLMCSILMYLPLDTYFGSKTLDKFYDYAQDFLDFPKESFMEPVAYEALNIIKDSKRYKNMKIYNYVSKKDEKIQFGAMTVRINGITTISYKGTDFSLIGWIENFRLSYEYPTYTHKIAIEYLNKNIRPIIDKEVYVNGHSKGGNLALVSAMETSDSNFKKIKKVYNFDGPGLRKDEFNSSKYRRVAKKLEHIVPSNSYIGVLLNDDKYTSVNSNAIAFNVHYPNTWEVFGECFVEEELSKISSNLHENTTKGIENIKYEDAKDVFETMFKNIDRDKSMNISIVFDNVLQFMKNMKNIDEDIKVKINNIFETIVKIKLNNKKGK